MKASIECDVRMLDGKPFTVCLLDPDEIVVLPQMRKTFVKESIAELAESIRATGQINEALVNHTDGKYVLIAGERRLRAVRDLNKMKPKEEEKKKLSCKIFEGLSAFEAFQLQIAENIHENVPPEQEAEALCGLWRIKKKTPELKGLPFRTFCRMVGKSETKVRQALRFINGLHPLIQKEVRRQGLKKKEESFEESYRISYTTAVQIARIKDKDEQLVALQVISSRNVSALRDVKVCLKPFLERQAQEAQNQLVDLEMTIENEVALLAKNIQGVEARFYERGLHFKSGLLYLIKKGMMPEEVLTPEVVRLLLASLEIKEELLALVKQREKELTA